jgi:hypothetical protein
LRCKKAATTVNLGNKFKKVELDFTPYEGIFENKWNGHTVYIYLERGA